MDYAEAERIEVAARNLEERGLDTNVLCARCQNGQVVRRRGKMDLNVWCQAMRRLVPTDIVECNKFDDAKAMDLSEMNQIAILVDKRKDVNDGSYV